MGEGTGGSGLDLATQRWVRLTGRRVDLSEHAWLAGPVGEPERIGSDFFERLATRERLRLRPADPRSGLMASFAELGGPGFAPERVHARVRDFYEHTSAYALDVWSQWSVLFRPFGGLLARLFSRRLQQLNVPLSPLSTTRGMRSTIVRLEDPATGALRYTGWLRENPALRTTVYVGVYSIASIPGSTDPCVKVVFPLPNGSATVLMRTRVEAGGALVLESAGRDIGDPGFYFLVRCDATHAWVRYLRTFRERIRVYVEPPDELRTDHTFTLWSRPFLRLHYHLRPKPAA